MARPVGVELGGARAWMMAEHLAEVAAAEPVASVRLLPAFDHYVVAATRHAERLMPGAFGHRVYRSQGWLSPVLLVNGRMDGIWRHERRGHRLRVSIEPISELDAAARRAVEEEAERLARYLDALLELSWY